MKEKELRLALVYYGGVSLTIYQHGVNIEILNLVRASKAYHRERGHARKQADDYVYQRTGGNPGADASSDPISTEAVYFVGRPISPEMVDELPARALRT